jgi:anaphase-promoting complex subunit 1
VNLDPATVPVDFTYWGEFHNGAAAALRLSPDLEGMSAAWIAYQRPAGEPTPAHGT